MSKVEFISREAHTAVVDSVGYSEAARAGNLLFVSGVVGIDESGNIVSGGIGAQAVQAYKNLRAVIEHAGGQLENIVDATYYVVDTKSGKTMEEDMRPVLQAKGAVLPKHHSAGTAVRVSGLFYPQLLVEIQVTVAL